MEMKTMTSLQVVDNNIERLHPNRSHVPLEHLAQWLIRPEKHSQRLGHPLPQALQSPVVAEKAKVTWILCCHRREGEGPSSDKTP